MAGATKSGDPTTEVGWSEFEGRSGISGLNQSDSSAGNREFDKICVLIDCVHDYDFGKYMSEGWVYCIDANSSYTTIKGLEPVIRWNLRDFSLSAMVILGSKLYLFGGAEKGFLWGFRFYYYDMKSAFSSPYKPASLFLPKESFEEGPPMKAIKHHPLAVVIGDYKICVFPTVLYKHRPGSFSYRNTWRPCFELLDTRRGHFKWESLPELFENYMACGETVSIKSYCVHRSCLIIQTCEQLGIYAIDVDNPEPKWLALHHPCGGGGGGEECFPFQEMFAMVDNMMFDPCQYPLTTIQPLPDRRGYEFSGPHPLGALCFDHRCKKLCRVKTMFPNQEHGFESIDDDGPPRLLLDFVNFDHVALDNLRFDLSDWENIQSDKSLTFELRSFCFDYMKSVAIYPIKTSDIDDSIEEEEENIRKKKKKMAEKQGRRTRQDKEEDEAFLGALVEKNISPMKKKRELSTDKY